MKLAKPVLDVGLFTTARDSMLDFWGREIGLPLDETLPLGGGVQQLRHALNGSVFKLNHSREPLADLPRGGYRELWIAREGIESDTRLCDPDGNTVVLVAPGTRGIDGIGVQLAVRDEAAHQHFYGSVLGLEPAGDDAYAWGGTRIFFRGDPQVPEDAAETCNPEMNGPGYRYLTVQVWDVDAEYARVIERGGRSGRPPVTLGKVARVAFIRDPDGNWIEISQRASLTGDLPG